jgi:hypothetical protein
MPGSFVSSLLSFLASHLVALTLSGFLLVGAHLAGFWDPGQFRAGSKATATENRQPSTTTKLPPPVAAPPTGTEAKDPPGEQRNTKQPVLIGGSLPNYRSAGETAFRPPPLMTEAQPSSSDREVMIQQARRAFWNGDFEGAETAYVKLISQYPDDADIFGELGNLYQSMGKPAEALDAYYAAAVRLRASGKREKLNDVIDLLDTYNYPDTSQLRP